MDSKSEIRLRMKARRYAMAGAEVASSSTRICSRFLDLGLVSKASVVLTYVSVGNEVATHDLIGQLLRRGKRVAVPRILDETSMEACEIRELDHWRLSTFGVPFPASGSPLYRDVDVCVVPGLAFSRHCDRLGFGRGHWDRFLEHFSARVIVGFCHDWQIVDNLPVEETDRPADLVMTDDRMLWRSGRQTTL